VPVPNIEGNFSPNIAALGDGDYVLAARQSDGNTNSGNSTTLSLTYDSTLPEIVTGKTLSPILQADGIHHDGVIFGYFGREVGMTDGRYIYYRMPLPNSTCDLHFTNYSQVRVADRKNAIPGIHLKTAKGIPHLKIEKPSALPRESDGKSVLFDLLNDPDQTTPLRDDSLEKNRAERLTGLMHQAQAPDAQFRRLGLD
jgi:hypothetical protein